MFAAVFARRAASAGWRRAVHTRAVADPVAATGLFYHALGDSEWAVSFLRDAPRHAESPAVIARFAVPPAAEPPEHLRRNPDIVRLNAPFWELLHSIFQEYAAQDEMLNFEANMRGDGWAHISDERHGLMLVRTPATDSIFGSVAFVNSTIDPATYERNAMYRFCMRTEGPMQLPEAWRKRVCDRLASMQ